MKIAFTELEHDEAEFFRQSLAGHEVTCASASGAIGEGTEVLSIFLHTKVDGPFLQRLPELRMIATRSTNFEHIDREAACDRDIAVSFVPSYGESTVAEHTFALILALSRRLIEATEAKPGFTYAELRGFDLKGKTLGVVGSGRIGLHVIRMARAFDMRVVAYDPEPQRFMEEILDFRYVPLDELLAGSDIVTLHASLVPETFHIINRETLARCKDGVLLINTARGALVDSEALAGALESGKVGGAGLDVLEDESMMQREAIDIIGDQIVQRLQASSANSELRYQRPERIQELAGLMRNNDMISRPNVVFTPHIGFNSREAVERINRVTLENIQSFVAGQPVNLLPGTASITAAGKRRG